MLCVWLLEIWCNRTRPLDSTQRGWREDRVREKLMLSENQKCFSWYVEEMGTGGTVDLNVIQSTGLIVIILMTFFDFESMFIKAGDSETRKGLG